MPCITYYLGLAKFVSWTIIYIFTNIALSATNLPRKQVFHMLD